MKIMLRTIVFLAILASMPLLAYAQDLSPECATEPTDVTLSYGDALVCAIESVGDSDVFRFFGNIGDRVIIEAERLAGNVLFICQQLIAPNGETLANTCENDRITRIDIVLSQAGVHTVVVNDENDDSTGTYNISISCLLGTCTPPEGDAMLAVAPPNHDFGPVNLNTASATQVFLVSNAIDPNAQLPRLDLAALHLKGLRQGSSPFSGTRARTVLFRRD